MRHYVYELFLTKFYYLDYREQEKTFTASENSHHLKLMCVLQNLHNVVSRP